MQLSPVVSNEAIWVLVGSVEQSILRVISKTKIILSAWSDWELCEFCAWRVFLSPGLDSSMYSRIVRFVNHLDVAIVSCNAEGNLHWACFCIIKIENVGVIIMTVYQVDQDVCVSIRVQSDQLRYAVEGEHDEKHDGPKQATRWWKWLLATWEGEEERVWEFVEIE